MTLLQDRLGFLWIGTQNGLVRYDGRAMHVFKEPSASGNVQIGNVQAIREDHRGDLWAGGLGQQWPVAPRPPHRAVDGLRARRAQPGLDQWQ